MLPLSLQIGDVRQRFGAALPSRASGSRPRPYLVGLQPAASPLRPHVLARERLLRWVPLSSRTAVDGDGRPLPLTDWDLRRVVELLSLAWADSTAAVYGSGLLVYHVYCDLKAVSEAQRAPTSLALILAFISTMAGSYSSSAIENYIAGLHAWHRLHGILWQLPSGSLDIAFTAAAKAAPESSKRVPRDPVMLDLIVRIHAELDFTNPFDTAVFACLVVVFWATARLGEFVLPTLLSFNPREHVKRSDLSRQHDRNGFEVTNCHLPASAHQGEKCC